MTTAAKLPFTIAPMEGSGCLHGYVTTTRVELTRVFGEPTQDTEYRTGGPSKAWELRFDDGVFAWIYDHYHFEHSPRAAIDWHVGGTSALALEHVAAWLPRSRVMTVEQDLAAIRLIQ